MHHAVAPEGSERPRSRWRATLDYYRRRAWRWGRVLAEHRPGTVRLHAGPRRVLVVRLDAIGDFVMWSGAARALRQWLGSDTHVTLVANALWADLARDPGVADQVWPVQRPLLEWDAAYRAELRARVHAGGFALAINAVFTREMMLGDSVVRWSRARERVGSAGDSLLLPPRERRWADGWYTRLLPASDSHMHETERHAEFLRALGVPLTAVPAPVVPVHHAAPNGLADLREGYFIVFPGASLAEKRWAPRNFAVVARYVQQQTGWRPVLLGDVPDSPVTREVAALVPGAIDLSGKTTVPELASAIQRARLVLTNDTSAAHLAAVSGVPAVCIVGGGHWRRFLPYPASLGLVADLVEVVSMVQDMTCFNCNWRCVLPHVDGEALPCVSRVPVERVIGAVDRVLSRVVVA